MKYNWSTFRVYIPEKGYKLVSELTNKETKDSLCEIIELVEKLANKAEESLALLNPKD